MVPGIGTLESLNKFAFKNAKSFFKKDVGEVSEAYQVTNGYVVVKVVDEKKEGVRPFDEVKESLKPRALREKKMAQLKNTVQQKYSSLGENGDLNSLTSDPNVSVQTTGEFALGGFVPTLGREFAVSGAAKLGAVGKVLPPVQSLRGFYLVKILSRTPFDSSAFNVQKKMMSAQILQGKKQQVLSQWLEKLKEAASIEDNRENFYR